MLQDYTGHFSRIGNKVMYDIQNDIMGEKLGGNFDKYSFGGVIGADLNDDYIDLDMLTPITNRQNIEPTQDDAVIKITDQSLESSKVFTGKRPAKKTYDPPSLTDRHKKNAKRATNVKPPNANRIVLPRARDMYQNPFYSQRQVYGPPGYPPISNPYNQYAPYPNYGPYGFQQNPAAPNIKIQLLDLLLKQRKGDSEESSSNELAKVAARQAETLEKISLKLNSIQETKHKHELDKLQTEAEELEQHLEKVKNPVHRNLKLFDEYGGSVDENDPLRHRLIISSSNTSPMFGSPQIKSSHTPTLLREHHSPSPNNYHHFHSPQQAGNRSNGHNAKPIFEHSGSKQQTKLPQLYPNMYNHANFSPHHHNDHKAPHKPTGTQSKKHNIAKHSPKKEVKPQKGKSKKEKEIEDSEEEDSEEEDLGDFDIGMFIYKPKKEKINQATPAKIQEPAKSFITPKKKKK